MKIQNRLIHCALAAVALIATAQSGNAQERTIYQGRLSVPTSYANRVLGAPMLSEGYLNEIMAQDGLHQWDARRMPIKIFIAQANGVPGYKPTFDAMMVDSINEWVEISKGKLTWVRVQDRAAADIVIRWTAQQTERERGTEAGLTKTTTRVNTQTGRGVISQVDMHIVTMIPGRVFGDAEIKKTCLHEVGHALGLQGHSSRAEDIMYHAISARQKGVLTARDQATINGLYSL